MEKIEVIESINQLTDYLEKIDKYNKSFENIYNSIPYNNDLITFHKELDKKRYDYYLKLGLNKYNLSSKEYFYNLIDLLENINYENIECIYFYELCSLNEGIGIDYILDNFEDFDIYLESEFNIIIDYTNKTIFNLDSNSLIDYLERFFKSENIKYNSYDLELLLNENEDTIEKFIQLI